MSDPIQRMYKSMWIGEGLGCTESVRKTGLACLHQSYLIEESALTTLSQLGASEGSFQMGCKAQHP